MVFPLVRISSEGVSISEAPVTMVEDVAKTGDETSSPSVITSTNLVLTVTFSVVLAIAFQRIYEVVSSLNAVRFC